LLDFEKFRSGFEQSESSIVTIEKLEFFADNLVMLLVPMASSLKIPTSCPRYEVVHNRVVFFEVLSRYLQQWLEFNFKVSSIAMRTC